MERHGRIQGIFHNSIHPQQHIQMHREGPARFRLSPLWRAPLYLQPYTVGEHSSSSVHFAYWQPLQHASRSPAFNTAHQHQNIPWILHTR